ncbi:glycosyltransferase family 2 protein [Allocatelliglobosispora scoriae]|nr:glycosyltransferase family 2 protein [Allocatelliglobosispora scoriae]
MLLSVVIAVHGVEDYLKECLDSILCDLRTDVEVIAVDDASPDGCPALLDSYADPRLRVIHLTANVGLGPARNVGLDAARGRYVWFVDSDDWLPAGAVAEVRAALSTEPDVLLIDHDRVSPRGIHRPSQTSAVLREAIGSVTVADQPSLLRAHTTAWNKVVRRSLLAEAGLRFPPGWYEDLPYSQPLLLAARRIEVLDRVCYHYRTRASGAITRTASDRQFEVFGQYDLLFAKLRPQDEQFRGLLCELMVNQLLVMLGSPERVAADRRHAFFREIVAVTRRHAPASGYPIPPGVIGAKHRMVAWNAYPAYAASRHIFRALKSKP